MHAKSILDNGKGYAYYGPFPKPEKRKKISSSKDLSCRILHPKWRDPNYIVLKRRAQILLNWTNQLPSQKLRIIDIGGRLQPYRPLVFDRIKTYIAIDPILEGMVDIVGVGEYLPFPNESFDLAICTQVLNYSKNPCQVISEIHRLLVDKGCLFLSVPAIFPRYHNQRWRFMPDGLNVLLESFSKVEIVPEGYSIANLFRVANLFFDTFLEKGKLKNLIKHILYPISNIAGWHLDRFSLKNSCFASNYSCRAYK